MSRLDGWLCLIQCFPTPPGFASPFGSVPLTKRQICLNIRNGSARVKCGRVCNCPSITTFPLIACFCCLSLLFMSLALFSFRFGCVSVFEILTTPFCCFFVGPPFASLTVSVHNFAFKCFCLHFMYLPGLSFHNGFHSLPHHNIVCKYGHMREGWRFFRAVKYFV